MMTREQMIDKAVHDGAYHTADESGYPLWLLPAVLTGSVTWFTPKRDVILARIRREFRRLADAA